MQFLNVGTQVWTCRYDSVRQDILGCLDPCRLPSSGRSGVLLGMFRPHEGCLFGLAPSVPLPDCSPRFAEHGRTDCGRPDHGVTVVDVPTTTGGAARARRPHEFGARRIGHGYRGRRVAARGPRSPRRPNESGVRLPRAHHVPSVRCRLRAFDLRTTSPRAELPRVPPCVSRAVGLHTVARDRAVSEVAGSPLLGDFQLLPESRHESRECRRRGVNSVCVTSRVVGAVPNRFDDFRFLRFGVPRLYRCRVFNRGVRDGSIHAGGIQWGRPLVMTQCQSCC